MAIDELVRDHWLTKCEADGKHNYTIYIRLSRIEGFMRPRDYLYLSRYGATQEIKDHAWERWRRRKNG